MTAAKLQARVEFWQKRLAPLGLQHWRFTVEVVDEAGGEPNNNAAVSYSLRYDSAIIQFAREFLADPDTNEQTIDESILHELMHVVMRDYGQAIDSIETHLAPPAKAVWHDQLHHELEGVVERLARALYETADV